MEEKNTKPENTPEVTAQPEVEETTATQTAPKEATNKTGLVVGGLVAAAIILGGYWYMSQNETALDAATTAEVNRTIEDEAVVAKVNGVELEGSLLNSQVALLGQQSQIPDLAQVDDATYAQIQAQALDSIVNTELVVQAAEAEGLSVTQEDVDAQYETIVAGVGGAEAAEQRLEQLGLSADEFKETLVSDLLIQKFLELDTIEDVVVTEEESRAFYDQVAAGQTGDVPPFEEVQFQIEQQLTFQKQQEVLSSLIGSLREGADIELEL